MAKKSASETNLPQVSKQTAGGVTGAVIGGVVGGPVGAVAGGVAGGADWRRFSQRQKADQESREQRFGQSWAVESYQGSRGAGSFVAHDEDVKKRNSKKKKVAASARPPKKSKSKPAKKKTASATKKKWLQSGSQSEPQNAQEKAITSIARRSRPQPWK